jgi:hypothetical protein
LSKDIETLDVLKADMAKLEQATTEDESAEAGNTSENSLEQALAGADAMIASGEETLALRLEHDSLVNRMCEVALSAGKYSSAAAAAADIRDTVRSLKSQYLAEGISPITSQWNALLEASGSDLRAAIEFDARTFSMYANRGPDRMSIDSISGGEQALVYSCLIAALESRSASKLKLLLVEAAEASSGTTKCLMRAMNAADSIGLVIISTPHFPMISDSDDDIRDNWYVVDMNASSEAWKRREELGLDDTDIVQDSDDDVVIDDVCIKGDTQ